MYINEPGQHWYSLNWRFNPLSPRWCVKQQAIARANVDLDLCRHMALLGNIESTNANLFQLDP